MHTLFAFVLIAGLTLTSPEALRSEAADPELAGNWVGAIDTTRGPMDIGLRLVVEKGKLVGSLKTAHGDWDVTGVTEKDRQWTVSFNGGGNEGTMTGRIEANKFSGEWKSKMADGTFALPRAPKR
jgi:hypothetical protein